MVCVPKNQLLGEGWREGLHASSWNGTVGHSLPTLCQLLGRKGECIFPNPGIHAVHIHTH